jgi:hypothetical protein
VPSSLPEFPLPLLPEVSSVAESVPSMLADQ